MSFKAISIKPTSSVDIILSIGRSVVFPSSTTIYFRKNRYKNNRRIDKINKILDAIHS